MEASWTASQGLRSVSRPTIQSAETSHGSLAILPLSAQG
jgi:hypothetical protein